MENESTTSTKSGLKWGIILGILTIIYGAVTQVFELWKINWMSIISIAISIVVIALAVRDHKQLNKGFLTIGEAVNISAIAGVISGLLGGLFNFVYTTFIDTNLPQKIKDFTSEKLSEQGLSDEQIEQALEMSNKFTSSPGLTFALGLILSLMFCAFIGLIVGAIMRKEKSVFD